jgi:NhaA family Na+:H+ antiporter
VIAAGGLSWAGLFFGGLHPALALVPIVPFMRSIR